MSRLLDYNPVTKTKRVFHFNHADNSHIVETVQDVEQILEVNKAQRAATDERAGYKGDGFHMVARVPMNILADLQRKGILDDRRSFEKWLNNKDNFMFRTRSGRV